MEERANFFDESIDRVQSAWSSVEDEFEKLQKGLEKRRKQFEKNTQKQVKKLRKTDFAKRVESIREDATRQFESNVETVLGLFPVASRAEVERLERKVGQLTRKVKALEKANAKANGAAKPAAQAAPEPDVEEARQASA